MTDRLEEGARQVLVEHGADVSAVRTVHAPGAYELPMVAHHVASAGATDAVICLGTLLRGETAHFDVLAHAVAGAVQATVRETGVPVSFGVITCDTLQQAEARAGGEHGNKGAEAALAAIEMATLYRHLDQD